MSANTIQFDMPGVRANCREPFRQRRLLMRRKQGIGPYANHERALEVEPFESCLK